ncbi:MAG: hypothetical protein ACKOZM_04545 [Flavobacteriales bacterium]
MKKSVTLINIGLSILLLTGCNNNETNTSAKGSTETKADSIQNAIQINTGDSFDKETTIPSAQSSTTDSLSKLIESNMTLKLPTKSGNIISSLGKYSKIEYENWDENPSGWGTRYIWYFSSGLVLTAQSDGDGNTPNNNDGVRSIKIEATNNNSVDILIYGLTLNKTNKSDCQRIFGSKCKSSSLGKDTLKVYKDNLYTYLTFNSSGLLVSIQQVTFNLEAAG